MNARRLFSGLCLSVLGLAAASPSFGLANRVFVSARSGNNANSCDNINTPCQTLTGALAQLNPGGEAIVLDSGGYGKVTITQSVTIEAPPGVTAFIHPSSGDAITVNAGDATVTLRGLVLNLGDNDGIVVSAIGTLNVEGCIITGFDGVGVRMLTVGRLNLKGTDIKGCGFGVAILNDAGVVRASIDHCHLDGNTLGYIAETTAPGSSTSAASFSTANGNSVAGWFCGGGTSGEDVIVLESCTGSENGTHGLLANSANAASILRYSNCALANNGSFGVTNNGSGIVESRGNNTITGNGTAPTSGTIGSFLPM